MNTNHNVKRTADILTIFTRAKDYIHPDIEKAGGHFCLVCRFGFFPKINAFCNILPRDKGVRQTAYFFSGGTSTLHTHIARYGAFISPAAISSLTLLKKRGPLRPLQRLMYKVEYLYQCSSYPYLKKSTISYYFDLSIF